MTVTPERPDMNASASLATPTPAMHAASRAAAPLTLPQCPRLSRLYRLQYEQVQTAWVLLYPEGMVKLNTSAAEILRRCNGERSVEAIVADIEILFNAKDIAPHVQSMLQEGMRRGWIV